MGDDADQLRAILIRFAHDPDDAALWPEARGLADRFTLDQLCAMATPRANEVRRLFDRILGRTPRRQDDSGTRRVSPLGKTGPTWPASSTGRGIAGAR
jgi:hypothetical protein